MKSNLFKTACSLFRDQIFSTFAQCLKAAWLKIKVVASMKKGNVSFKFIKSDGTERVAQGALTGFDYTPKTTESKPKAELVKYFDLEVLSFRSFRIDRFVSII